MYILLYAPTYLHTYVCTYMYVRTGHCAKCCCFIRGTLNPSQSQWMRHQETKPNESRGCWTTQRMLRHPSHQRNQSRLSHPARKCLYQQDWLQVTLLTSQQTKNHPRWGKYASTWHGHGAIVEKFVEGMQVQAIERMVTHFAASKVACPWKTPEENWC